jgi:hypothetical protein
VSKLRGGNKFPGEQLGPQRLKPGSNTAVTAALALLHPKEQPRVFPDCPTTEQSEMPLGRR